MKTVFITGASSGIGKAAALLATEKGWTVFLGFREGQDRAEKVQSEIRAKKGMAFCVKCDLSSPESIDQAVSSIATQTQNLDAVVLCASPLPILKSFLKTEMVDYESHLSANITGTHRLLTQIWKTFFNHQAIGHVVAVLSAAMGPPPRPHMTSYVVGKQGLATVLECALAELGTSGLRISAISPGYTDTPMLQSFHPHILESIKAVNPKKPFLAPKEVAESIMTCLENPPQDPSFTIQPLNAALTYE